MKILLHSPSQAQSWVDTFKTVLPEADTRLWQPGDTDPADYVAVWKPVPGIMANRTGLKAIFNLGAGVDAILKLPDLPRDIPIIRVDDGGLAIQMAEYVSYAVLRHFRHFDLYAEQASKREWIDHPIPDKNKCQIGLLGMGILGQRIAQSLQHLEFTVSGWSRTPKHMEGITCLTGADGLEQLLAQSNVLICILPLTEETTDILNHKTLSKLPKGAYVINIARGQHVVEEDLLALVQQGHLSGAMLDVFREEPLPPSHPFWAEPRIQITPHISALTSKETATRQIADKIRRLQQGLPVAGLVDPVRGY